MLEPGGGPESGAADVPESTDIRRKERILAPVKA
jgi:hypothetical protein